MANVIVTEDLVSLSNYRVCAATITGDSVLNIDETNLLLFNSPGTSKNIRITNIQLGSNISAGSIKLSWGGTGNPTALIVTPGMYNFDVFGGIHNLNVANKDGTVLFSTFGMLATRILRIVVRMEIF